MMRILVTYGWCRTARIAAESLYRPGFEVYACGSTALSMVRVSRFVRRFDCVPDPFKEPDQYVTAISATVKDKNRCRRIDRPRTYDDFRWHDHLPLLMELTHYGSSFLGAGENLNPMTT